MVTRAISSQAESNQARERLAALEAELESNRQLLGSATVDLAAARTRMMQSQQEAADAAQSLAELEHHQEASRAAILDAVASASDLRNQLTQAEERLAAVDREAQRLHAEMATAHSQVEAFGGQRGQLALEFETVSQRVAGLTEEIVQTRQALEAKRRAESEAKSRLDSLRAQYATAFGKKGSLEAVIAEHGYSTESVRRLFQSGGMHGGLAPAGVLADFLEVEPRFEGVVEDFLRDELNYVVVKSWDAAREGLRLLSSNVDGRATFLVHPDDSQARFSFLVDEAGQPAPPHESILPLKHAVRVLNGFGRSLEVILPKLRDGYIVRDPAFARELALENPNAFFLSQSGECFHNVTVTGGKQRAEGPLSMKRELRDVMKMLVELEAALRNEETLVLTLGREIKDLTSLLDRLEAGKRQAETQAMTSGHLLQQLDSEMERVVERLLTSEQEVRRLAAERAEQESLVSARQAEMAVLQERQAELERFATAAQEQLAGLRERRDLAAQNASLDLAGVAALEERHRAAAAGLERIESLVSEMRGRLHQLRSQIDSAFTEILEREDNNQEIARLLEDIQLERNACEARDGLLEFESEQVRARLAEIDEALRYARQLLEQARDRRAEISAAAAKLHVRRPIHGRNLPERTRRATARVDG